MNAYFFNVSDEEKKTIKEMHKEVYNGYTVLDKTPSEQPLTIEDLAGDKKGLVVTNTGEVKEYTNNKINEEVDECDMDEEKEEVKEDDLGDVEGVEDMDLGEEIEDEDLKEEFKKMHGNILEMFNRVSKF